MYAMFQQPPFSKSGGNGSLHQRVGRPHANRIGYLDAHTMVCHRGTLAHNTVLPGGFTQKIGVEGYGWIPRHYTGDRLAYVLGDASNAYGNVESPLWLMRGHQSGLEYSEENGWGDPGLKTFRRHVVDLGYDGLLFVFDELEADDDIDWHYRLHSVAQPLTMEETADYTCITARNGGGISDAYLFAPAALTCDITDKFRIPAKDWLKDGGKERPNHSHFTAVTEPARRMAFATIVDTRAAKAERRTPVVADGGNVTVGKWQIAFVLDGPARSFVVTDTTTGDKIEYTEDGPTVITENGIARTLNDILPTLEM